MNRGAEEDSGQGRLRGQPRSPFERRGAPRRVSVQSSPSNKRLKLAGGDRLKGSGVLCAGAHELSFNHAALGERVARSLSAVR